MLSRDPVFMYSVCNNQLRHACMFDIASKCVLSKLDALNIASLSWGLVYNVICHALWDRCNAKMLTSA